MSKICFIFVFLTVVMHSYGDTKIKDKDLAKSTTLSYRVTEDENSDDTVRIPLEGQSKPIKLNVTKNSTKEKPNRSRIVPRKNAPKITTGEKSENGSSSMVSRTVNANPQNVSLVINTPNESNTSTTRSTRKRKPKSKVTVGEQDTDASMEQSPVETSRKMDYIIPAAITLTTLPLMGAVFYILYKRGRDYWDKRHYRRMDFLINGMYNE